MHAVLLFACTALPALAQTTLVFPPEYERAWGRSSSAALGSNVTRTQMCFANPFPPGTVVLGVGLRPTTSTLDRAAFTAEVEVRMSSTAATPGALNSTFSANVGSDQVTALPRQLVNIPAMPANRSTGAFATFMFPVPFVFGTNAQPNILVELFVYSRSAGASWLTDRAFASTSGRAVNAGIGCGAGTITSSSAGGTYVAGSTVTISLAGAPANTLGVLMYSFDQKELVPGVPLPLDLSVIGSALGCQLMINTNEGFSLHAVDALGAAAVSFPVPPGIGQFGVGSQWGYFIPPTPANPAGLEVTANRAIWIGPEVVVPNAQYVYSLASATTLTGTATVDSVPVVQFILP